MSPCYVISASGKFCAEFSVQSLSCVCLFVTHGLQQSSRHFLFSLHWVFVAACGLSLVAVSRGYSLVVFTNFSLQWFLLLQSMGL